MSELPPGSVLGILGGGQLGRMLVQAGHQLGYRVAVLDPDRHCPAGQLADFTVTAGLGEKAVVRQFARAVPALTYESETVAPCMLREAENLTSVAPGSEVLRVTSDRLEQRAFLARLRVPTPAFRPLRDSGDIASAVDIFPALLKTARHGFDGRGQRWLSSAAQLRRSWRELGNVPAVLERRIELSGEFSVIVARSQDGETRTFEPIRNVHRDGILQYSVCPAGLEPAQLEVANLIAVALAEVLGLVGLLCVEFFLNSAGRVLVNEFAARPHNSGHLTIEAASTSQFSQHIRALAGLPLGGTSLVSPAAMVNLIGVDLQGPPTEELAPGVFLHRYGKSARPNRKVGHITALSDSPAAALRRALEYAEPYIESVPAIPA